ncbi:MAG TPA: hypothetical protein VF475_12145 [Sphingobium sp.]
MQRDLSRAGHDGLADAILASSAALTVLREAELGVGMGHAELIGVITRFIDQFESGG